MESKKTLDCFGLFCPMPIIKIKTEIDNLNPGEILEVIADDPGFEKDLPSWCRTTGNELVKINKQGNIIKGYVRKK